MMPRTRGVILPVVLFVLLLLGLLGAMFAFRVNADLAATQAEAFRLQTRLAAEAGIDRVKLLLRDDRFNIDRWYDNIEELHRIIVWMPGKDDSVWGTNEEFEDASVIYRFSIVADDPTDDEDFVRFGITDESAKLNLNQATEEQMLILVRAAVAGDEQVDPQAIVDAILDWRDADQNPRGESGDTEGEYYQSLARPYAVKNGPFDTVEELLLVKGVTGRILYGEDWDRNGLLTPNEDDGDQSFPMDNQDNLLNRGLYPYLTVYSLENNVSNDNRPRVCLYGPEEPLRQELTAAFPDDPGAVEFIIAATRQRSAGKGGKQSGPSTGSPSTGKGDGQGGESGAGLGSGPNTTGGKADGAPQKQAQSDDPDAQNVPPGTGDEEEAGNSPPDDQSASQEGEGNESADENQQGGQTSQRFNTPAALLKSQVQFGGQIQASPLTAAHLAMLLDRTTTLPPEQKTIPGLININTAPRLVLRCIDGLSEDQITGIIERRPRLSPEARMTPAWLVTEEVVDLDTFVRIAPQITARGQRFTIESLGYADHVGMVTRLEVVVDMLGPIAQTIYYRDVSSLGAHFPIRKEDLERIRVH